MSHDNLSSREADARDAYYEALAADREEGKQADLSNLRQAIRDFHNMHTLKAADVMDLLLTIMANNGMSDDAIDELAVIDLKD